MLSSWSESSVPEHLVEEPTGPSIIFKAGIVFLKVESNSFHCDFYNDSANCIRLQMLWKAEVDREQFT